MKHLTPKVREKAKATADALLSGVPVEKKDVDMPMEGMH